MRSKARTVSATDVDLLRVLAEVGSVVAASRRVGVTRDSANYRLARLAIAFGGPVVASVRGGSGHGATRLTPLGERIARRGFDAVQVLGARPIAPLATPNVVGGVFRPTPAPCIELRDGRRLRVTFRADPGEAVEAVVDPETILLALRPFPSSARNVLPGTVERAAGRGDSRERHVLVRVGSERFRVAVTGETVRQLQLRAGRRVWLFLKATAIHRIARAGGRAPRAPLS